MWNILKEKLFASDINFKSRIFNMLDLVGFFACISVLIISILNGTTVINSIILIISSLVFIFLLIFSSYTHNYYTCYLITIVLVFMILFPIMFFTAGGYISGMPSFFVAAVAFTLFMVGNKIGAILSLIEIIIYVSCCIIAYNNPSLVNLFPNERAILIDVITGIIVASLTLGATMFLQSKMFIMQHWKTAEAMNEAKRSSNAKGVFLANMSHEIRTPINVILGTNELINRSWDPEEIHEYTSTIQSSSNLLLSIITNILDMTQIESGKIITKTKPYRTDSLLSELAIIGSELSKKKELAFNTEISPKMMSILEGDKNHLRQILTNFISNAVKYTDKGSITLFAKTDDLKDGTALFTIKVSDTGIGIRDKDLEHIFETFRRGRNAIEAAVEGAGLGLSIAKALADALGGKLIVESKENVGSTFGIEIVQKICDNSSIGEISPKINDRSCSDSFIAPDCRILAVDDNIENLRVIELLLERTMITVDTALDGYSAVEKVSQNDYDLIILDYMMPDLDGIDTFRKMRENGLSENIPVVALTAEALAGSEDKFLSAGFTTYLSKPVSWHNLEKTLINLLPADKITISGASEDSLTDEEFNILSEKLSKYDIDLESGLSFLSGNITQFCSLAEIYIDGYEHNFDKIRKMFEDRNTDLVFEVHSLKSASKGLGAKNLYEQAAELEKRLKNGDMEYAVNAKNLFLFEWDRATDGMRLLVDEISGGKDAEASDNINSNSLLLQIEKGLEEHIWLDTQNAIHQLIDIEEDEEKKKTLTYMAGFVDELDFVSAITLFNQIKRKE